MRRIICVVLIRVTNQWRSDHSFIPTTGDEPEISLGEGIQRAEKYVFLVSELISDKQG
jgi:hypothetical protein